MVQFHSLRWRIAFAYMVLIVAIMAGLTLFLTRQVRAIALANLQGNLLANAQLLANNRTLRAGLVAGEWDPDAEDLLLLVQEWGRLLDTRVTLLTPAGTVLADSAASAAGMEDHASRPEIVAALEQGYGEITRFSRTTGSLMFYVAVPIHDAAMNNGDALGVLRLALPISEVEQNVAPLRAAVLVGGLIATLLTGLLSIFIAERIARPVRRLTEMATQMSQGHWGARLYPTRHDEVGQLIRAFNRMADRLQVQMSVLQREQERLATVLDNTVDGVLILDGEGRVQSINPAAARLLQVELGRVSNLSLPQVVRDHRLVELWQRSQRTAAPEEAMLELGRYVIRVVSTPFGEGTQLGYNVLLQDLTQLRRLETVRRDFVSNISHELRTPLASLRALVETLRHGAMDDPPAAERFLDQIETEVDALSQMVQELLELSRIESGRVPLRLRPTSISEIVLRPVERLQPQAERAGIDLIVDLPGGLPPVMADAERMQQVITNLVHNAIKFTPAGGAVTVHAERRAILKKDHAVVSVADTGVGIPAEDLPRIFERFYKADRARSAGGTGLGLAIAKHIVQIHSGRIWAESVEGKGSTFYFTLPIAPGQ